MSSAAEAKLSAQIMNASTMQVLMNASVLK